MTEEKILEEVAEETTASEVPAEAIAGEKPKITTVRLAKMAMLIAISVVLVWLVHFPIIPVVPFLEYDPADIPILLGTFAFGPLGGMIITIITAIIQGMTVSAASSWYGIVMHICATGAFVLTAGLIYKKYHTRKGALVALGCGVLAMTLIMIPANLILTPVFMGAPRAAVVALLPAIIAFNAIKAGINAVVTLLIYKRVSGFLHKQ